MFWILINTFLFVINLTSAVNAESVGWAAFNGFFAGLSAALMIWSLVTYMDGGDQW